MKTFLVVFSFAAGVLVMDTAHEYRNDVVECEANRENAERYAKLLSHVLNGGGLEVDETRVSCRVKHNRSKA